MEVLESTNLHVFSFQRSTLHQPRSSLAPLLQKSEAGDGQLDVQAVAEQYPTSKPFRF